MIVYLGIFFVAAFFSVALPGRQLNWLLALMFGMFLVFFAGTRYYVGCDYVGYLLRFERIDSFWSWAELFAREEPGFNGLMSAVKNSGIDYGGFILVMSSIYVFCMLRFSSLALSPLKFLVLALPVLMIQLGMSGMRQAMALGFLMLSFVSFTNEKKVMTAIWIVIAAQFHTSAIVFLPMAFLAGKHLSLKRILAGLIVMGPIVVFLIQDRLGVYSDRYIEQIHGENSASGAWFRYALVLLPFIMLAVWYRQVEERFPRHIELLRLFMLITFFLAPVGFLSSVALHRLVFYVMPISIITLLCVTDTLAHMSRYRLFPLSFPFVMYGAYILVWFSFSSKASSCYVPYQSWLL